MISRAQFAEAIRGEPGLPALFRQRAADVTAMEERRLDESYLEFLDSQIELSPRGPEWTAVLVRRRAALLSYCGVILCSGTVRVGDTMYIAKLHPATGRVVHWEEWDCGPVP